MGDQDHAQARELSRAAEDGYSRAVSWLRVQREHFKFADATDAVTSVLLLKPFTELVLTMAALRSWADGVRDVDETLSWCWEHSQRGKALVRMLLARPDMVELAGCVAAFAQCGYRNEQLTDLLMYHAQSSAAEAELPSWRRIAISHALEELGLAPFPPSEPEDSWLARQPEAWMISENTAYGVTHEVFYVTDFGSQPGRLSTEASKYLALWLPVWIRIFVTDRNPDLVAELVAVCYYSGCCDGADSGLAYLLSEQGLDGSVEGPRGAGLQLQHLVDGLNRSFAKAYHTTLVSTLAFSAAARCQRVG